MGTTRIALLLVLFIMICTIFSCTWIFSPPENLQTYETGPLTFELDVSLPDGA